MKISTFTNGQVGKHKQISCTELSGFMQMFFSEVGAPLSVHSCCYLTFHISEKCPKLATAGTQCDA